MGRLNKQFFYFIFFNILVGISNILAGTSNQQHFHVVGPT